jgi:hypothetical protein
MWVPGPGEEAHPDEGTIHAWLDDALDDASAARVSAHVASCAACTARTAEARGLIAGASRIVAALDDVPAGRRPAWAAAATTDATRERAKRSGPEGAAATVYVPPARPSSGSVWRSLRVTPARAAIAATIIVAVGVTLTNREMSRDSTRVGERTAAESPMTAPSSAAPLRAERDRVTAPAGGGGEAATAAAPPAPAPAPSFDTAAPRRIASAQPERKVERAPGPAIPQPSAADEAGANALGGAGAQVAVGRAAVEAQRETTTAARPDQVRIRGMASDAAAPQQLGEIAAADAAERRSASAAKSAAAPGAAPRVAPSAARGEGQMLEQRRYAGAMMCFTLTSEETPARWGSLPLPLLVTVSGGSAVGSSRATVRPVAGSGGARAATWIRSADDSVRLTLDQSAATPPIAFGATSAGTRAGRIRDGTRATVALTAAECPGQ